MILFLTEKHISQLICNANQLTGFYMRGTLVFNQVSHDFLKVIADFEFFICGLDMAIRSITTEVFSKMFFL